MPKRIEPRWVGLSMSIDHASNKHRYVKTLAVECGHGRLALTEVVGERDVKSSAEDILTTSFYDRMRGSSK